MRIIDLYLYIRESTIKQDKSAVAQERLLRDRAKRLAPEIARKATEACGEECKCVDGCADAKCGVAPEIGGEGQD